MKDPKNKKRDDNPDDYNTIDNIDEYLRGVVASDTFRFLRFNGNG